MLHARVQSKYRLAKILWLWFVVCCGACSLGDNTNYRLTPPAPSVLDPLAPRFTLQRLEINGPWDLCLIVFTSMFWEQGDSPSEIEDHITATLYTTLDDETLQLSRGGTLDFVYPTLYYCFHTAHLETGLHTVTAQASTRSGVEYVQTWQFEVGEHETIVIPSLDETPTL